MEKVDGNKTITAGAENLQIPEKGRYVETYNIGKTYQARLGPDLVPDLAVVFTTQNMHFNPKTQAICLPENADNVADVDGNFFNFQQEDYHSMIQQKDCKNLGLNDVCVELQSTSPKVGSCKVFNTTLI